MVCQTFGKVINFSSRLSLRFNISIYTHDLKEYLQVSDINVIGKFFRKRRDIIKNYVNIETGKSYHPTKYILNDEGKKYISLMYHFWDYYNSLRQD